MTTLIVVGLLAVAVAVACGGPVSRYVTVWTRVWTLAVSFGLFDSSRQAERASHTTGGHRAPPPERGIVVPYGIHDGQPRNLLIYGRVNQHGRDHPGLLNEIAHYTGRDWTLARVWRSQWLRLAQAPPPLPALPMPHVRVAPAGWWDRFPIGTGRDGPVWWEPADDATANLLVVARTGWGKSHLAANLLDHADASGGRWHVYVLDPEDGLPLDGHDSVRAVGATPAAILDVLELLDVQFEHGAADRDERLLLLADEFPSIMEAPLRSDPDYEARRQSIALIRKDLARGRKRRIHIAAFGQDPRAKVLGGTVRSQFGARLAGWLDLPEYPLVLRRPVARLLAGHGHGWWSAAERDPVEVQTYARAHRPPPEGPAHTTAHRPMPAITGRPRR